MDRYQREVLLEAADNRRELANRMEPVLTVNGVGFSGQEASASSASGVQSMEVIAEDDPGVLLEANLSTRLQERKTSHTPVSLDFIVEGDGRIAEIPAFRGEVTTVSTKGPFTFLRGATAAYHWQKTPLGREIEHVNAPPHIVLSNALAALQHRYANIELDPLDEPKTNAYGTERLKKYDKIGGVVDLVKGDPEILRVVDTPLNVATLYMLGAIDRQAEPVWEFEEGRDCEIGSVTVEGAEEGRYAYVEVFRTLVDGRQETMARSGVDNKGLPVSETDIYEIEYTADDASAGKSAYNIAFLKVGDLALNSARISVPVRYWPFWLRRGQIVGVSTREITTDGGPNGEAGDWIRRYLMRVETMHYGPEKGESTVSGQGVMVSEEFQRAKIWLPSLPAPSGQLWGTNYRGVAYLDEDLEWVEFVPERQAIVLDRWVAARKGVKIFSEGENVIIEDGHDPALLLAEIIEEESSENVQTLEVA